MLKATILAITIMFVGVVGFAQAQTATPTVTPAPTSATVPAGAPSTGFGK
ncbi:MAG: hypothetical protein KBD51_03460 [Candidatus Levybacteria bacterium]|nr:hypothetical protein [Candidatus Levybacteria bacterium]